MCRHGRPDGCYDPDDDPADWYRRWRAAHYKRVWSAPDHAELRKEEQ